MQFPIIAHRGQVKPYGSIPRINWGHPLTKGLISYCYDIGCGPIDLATGFQRVITNTANPPFAGPVSNKYGSALKGVTTGSANVTIAPYNVPGNADINNLIVAAPYSYACGVVVTAAPTGFSLLYGTCDAGGIPPVAAYVAATTNTDFAWRINNGTISSSATGAQNRNSFQTLLCVALTGSTTQCYIDGKASIAPAVTTTAVAGTDIRPTFLALRNQAAQTVPSAIIFYGALWKGRALTASEARLLHDDPYCFLIYPEDDMFASLTRSSFAGYIFNVGQNSNPPNTRMIGY